jgi:hypothetical protein
VAAYALFFIAAYFVVGLIIIITIEAALVDTDLALYAAVRVSLH